jgi:hypothetical protein
MVNKSKLTIDGVISVLCAGFNSHCVGHAFTQRVPQGQPWFPRYKYDYRLCIYIVDSAKVGLRIVRSDDATIRIGRDNSRFTAMDNLLQLVIDILLFSGIPYFYDDVLHDGWSDIKRGKCDYAQMIVDDGTVDDARVIIALRASKLKRNAKYEKEKTNNNQEC